MTLICDSLHKVDIDRVAARICATREHADFEGMCILAYEVLADQNGHRMVHRLAVPLRLRVERGDENRMSHWRGDWLVSYWRVSLTAPHPKFPGSATLYVRASEFASDRKCRRGAVACVVAGPATPVVTKNLRGVVHRIDCRTLIARRPDDVPG
ncbi:hypothetical protein [Burkholderia sp. Ac-20365]|uniref:hypothetical protein n=1 Tax=Burkholderia sp. Ac-20365 TaxID=2703897 RepID=UPI00197C3263|nr:hypothetical protein [Burkholderia sp. Ac-20365]MBN3760928.1 hypothetical protein [Burkholderia sp. Ac-20365]